MSEEKNEDFISTLPRYLPLIILITVCFGLLRLTLFYSKFNVNILPYLEITEIIFQTVNDLLILLMSSMTGVLVGSIKKIDGDEVVANDARSFFVPMYLNKKCYKISIASISVLIIVVNLRLFGVIGDVLLTYIFILILTIISINYTIREFGKYYHLNPHKEVNKINILLCFVVIFSAAFGAFKGFGKAVDIKKNDVYLGNSIVSENKEIHSTPTYYYIGKTNNYVFFYNEETKATDVFPMSTVTKLTINE